jgi:hypothetical protein
MNKVLRRGVVKYEVRTTNAIGRHRGREQTAKADPSDGYARGEDLEPMFGNAP